MALRYELENIDNWEIVCRQPKADGGYTINGVTETLIFVTMVVGMNEITDANWKEFYSRLRYYDRLTGWLDGYPGFRANLMRHVREHIGLRTNASRKTTSEFKKHVWQLHTEAVDHEWSRYGAQN